MAKATGTKSNTKRHEFGTDVEPVGAESAIEGNIVGVDEGGFDIFDQMAQELNRAVTKDPLVLKVPLRPALKLVFDVNFDFDTYQMWVNRTVGGKHADKPNYMALARAVLSNQNTAILFNDVEVDSRVKPGNILRVTSAEFHQMLGAPQNDVPQALKRLYGHDADMISAMRQVVEKAGYSLDGDDSEDEEGPLHY